MKSRAHKRREHATAHVPTKFRHGRNIVVTKKGKMTFPDMIIIDYSIQWRLSVLWKMNQKKTSPV